MKQNLEILVNMVVRPFTSAGSMEELPHISLYKRGEISYEENQYHMCITYFEEPLTFYYNELQKCHELWKYQHEKHQASYSALLFSHFKAFFLLSPTLSDVFNKNRFQTFHNIFYTISFSLSASMLFPK